MTCRKFRTASVSWNCDALLILNLTRNSLWSFQSGWNNKTQQFSSLRPDCLVRTVGILYGDVYCIVIYWHRTCVVCRMYRFRWQCKCMYIYISMYHLMWGLWTQASNFFSSALVMRLWAGEKVTLDPALSWFQSKVRAKFRFRRCGNARKRNQ